MGSAGGTWSQLPTALGTCSMKGSRSFYSTKLPSPLCFIHTVQGWKVLKFLPREDQEQIVCDCVSIGWCCYQLAPRTACCWISVGVCFRQMARQKLRVCHQVEQLSPQVQPLRASPAEAGGQLLSFGSVTDTGALSCFEGGTSIVGKRSRAWP